MPAQLNVAVIAVHPVRGQRAVRVQVAEDPGRGLPQLGGVHPGRMFGQQRLRGRLVLVADQGGQLPDHAGVRRRDHTSRERLRGRRQPRRQHLPEQRGPRSEQFRGVDPVVGLAAGQHQGRGQQRRGVAVLQLPRHIARGDLSDHAVLHRHHPARLSVQPAH
jgi:hypothetical protein